MKRRTTRLSTLPARLRRRPTKTQLTAATLISLLCLGPIIAFGFAMSVPGNPVTVLAEGVQPPSGGAKVKAQVVSLAPTSGTARLRVTVEPTTALLDGTVLKETVVMHVNDNDSSAMSFAAGSTLHPFDVTVDLQGQSVRRYPFDEYQLGLVFRLEQVVKSGVESPDGTVSVGNDTETEQLPVTVDLTSEVSDFNVKVDPFTEGLTSAADAVGVGFTAHRPLTTTIWVVGVMLLMWGLAIVGVMIVWAVLIWEIEVPAWSIGFLVGVLFALPPLRAALPGSPPPGTLLDFVAFYWAVGITGITVITTIGVWLQRSRPLPMDANSTALADTKANKSDANDAKVDKITKEHTAITVDEPAPGEPGWRA